MNRHTDRFYFIWLYNETLSPFIILNKPHHQYTPYILFTQSLYFYCYIYSQVVNIDEVVKALVDYHDTAIYLLDSSVQQLLVTVNLASIIKVSDDIDVAVFA